MPFSMNKNNRSFDKNNSNHPRNIHNAESKTERPEKRLPLFDCLEHTHIPHLLQLWRNDRSAENGTINLSATECEQLGTSLIQLQRGLTGSRALAGTTYMQSPSLLGAYLLYYWPISYAQIRFALCSVQEHLISLAGRKDTPIRILDLGSGPAPASAAICDAIFSVCKRNASLEVLAVDVSASALQIASSLFKKSFPEVHIKTECSAITSEDYIQQKAKNDFFDIIVLSHALNEMWYNQSDALQRRIAFLQKVSAQLSPNGILLLCEPALLQTSRDLLRIRDSLCSSGFWVLAPCPQSNPCPALHAGEQHTCHADCAWRPPKLVASLANVAGLERKSVKMTYLVLQKHCMTNTNPDGLQEKPCLLPHERHTHFRVVSEAMRNKAGRVRYLLCNGKQRIALSAKNGDAHAKTQGFFSLRRYDGIYIKNPSLRGDANKPSYGVEDYTELQTEPFIPDNI